MSHSASLLPRINKSSVLRSLYHDDDDGDDDDDDGGDGDDDNDDGGGAEQKRKTNPQSLTGGLKYFRCTLHNSSN